MIFRVLARAIPAGLPCPVLKGPLRGAWWIAGAAAGPGKGLSVLLHRSETRRLDVARSLIDRKSVCIDVGANVGLYSVLFGRYGRKVYAVEPIPRNIALLQRHLRLNGLDNVTILPWAVSNRMALQGMALGRNCAEGHLVEGGEQPALAVSLDEVVEHYRIEPDLIKIDVEGEELRVIHGAKRALTRYKPKILLEVHSIQLRKLCLAALAELGYSKFEALDTPSLESAMDYAVQA